MTRPYHRLAVLLLAVVPFFAAGCNRCGDRPRLLGRLRDRTPDDDDRRATDRFRDAARDPARDPNCDPCNDVLPPPRRSGFDGTGRPLSGGTGRFVSPISGMPYSDPVPLGGYPPFGTPVTPGAPFGGPIRIGDPTREDELPPGTLIPSPNVPLAPPRTIEGGKLFPPLGGNGAFTSDPRK